MEKNEKCRPLLAFTNVYGIITEILAQVLILDGSLRRLFFTTNLFTKNGRVFFQICDRRGKNAILILKLKF